MRRKAWIILFLSTVVFSSCSRRHQVYSNASLNQPYPYSSRWDYTGYHPDKNDEAYRRYDPDRREDIVKKIELKGRDVENF